MGFLKFYLNLSWASALNHEYICISNYWISQPGSPAGFYTWLSVRYFACSNMLDPGMSLKHKFVTLVFITFFKQSYFQVNNFGFDVSLLCCCQINPLRLDKNDCWWVMTRLTLWLQWWHMAIYIRVNIGWWNGLLPDGTKLLPEPTLIYHQCSSVAITLDNFKFKRSAHDIIL